MNFSNPIPRGVQPKYHEGSALRSVRDADTNARQWSKNSSVGGQNDNLMNAVSKTQRDLASLRRRQLGYQGNTILSHPFKIYQPTNYSTFTTGRILSETGAVTVCNINASVPTNLAAIPPTVNPATDSWRFWSVRSGLVEKRLDYSYSPLNTMSNWALLIDTENTDGVTLNPIGPFNGNDFDASTTETLAPPIILNGSINSQGFAAYSFFIIITPDGNPNDIPTPSEIPIAKIAMQTGLVKDVEGAIQPFGSTVNSANIIPVGVIAPTATNVITGPFSLPLVANQLIFDHARNRYPGGNGNFGTCGIMNFRGTWDASTTYVPADLDEQIFYPGDVVSVFDQAQGPGSNQTMFQFIGVKPLPWPSGGPNNDSTNWGIIFQVQQ
jgi:hypothetical protein